MNDSDRVHPGTREVTCGERGQFGNGVWRLRRDCAWRLAGLRYWRRELRHRVRVPRRIRRQVRLRRKKTIRFREMRHRHRGPSSRVWVLLRRRRKQATRPPSQPATIPFRARTRMRRLFPSIPVRDRVRGRAPDGTRAGARNPPGIRRDRRGGMRIPMAIRCGRPMGQAMW